MQREPDARNNRRNACKEVRTQHPVRVFGVDGDGLAAAQNRAGQRARREGVADGVHGGGRVRPQREGGGGEAHGGAEWARQRALQVRVEQQVHVAGVAAAGHRLDVLALRHGDCGRGASLRRRVAKALRAWRAANSLVLHSSEPPCAVKELDVGSDEKELEVASDAAATMGRPVESRESGYGGDGEGGYGDGGSGAATDEDVTLNGASAAAELDTSRGGGGDAVASVAVCRRAGAHLSTTKRGTDRCTPRAPPPVAAPDVAVR